MDDARRRAVSDALVGFDQVWITSAEEEYTRGAVPTPRLHGLAKAVSAG
jgi:hypothetical protein